MPKSEVRSGFALFSKDRDFLLPRKNFEPAHRFDSGFQVHRLNHSATLEVHLTGNTGEREELREIPKVYKHEKRLEKTGKCGEKEENKG